jgi:hypothetical protein
LFWGFLVLVLLGSVLYTAWRFRKQRWMIWGVGTVGMLILLWFFFGAISPLLPASF